MEEANLFNLAFKEWVREIDSTHSRRIFASESHLNFDLYKYPGV